uniref:Putative secreted protein n=1 Tax=Anopheles darlingi TaxID=43151 RepID=A0A2M4D684_ANODA
MNCVPSMSKYLARGHLLLLVLLRLHRAYPMLDSDASSPRLRLAFMMAFLECLKVTGDTEETERNNTP